MQLPRDLYKWDAHYGYTVMNEGFTGAMDLRFMDIYAAVHALEELQLRDRAEFRLRENQTLGGYLFTPGIPVVVRIHVAPLY